MFKKIILIGLTILVLCLLLNGCQKKSDELEGEDDQLQKGGNTTTTMDSDVAAIAAMEEELNSTDLENLEGDLENLDW